MSHPAKSRKAIILFFLLIAIVAFANGLGDAVMGNYFKEVYSADSVLRGFIEFPRELPGMLCAVVVSLLSPLGDRRAAFLAQLLACGGLVVLGVWTPSFGVMLVFLFIYSMGMHLYMPYNDAIGLSLAEQDNVGRRIGQYTSVKSAFMFAASLLVFFGFRFGFFSFETKRKTVFLVAAAGFAAAAVIAFLLAREGGVQPRKQKVRLVFRKQYRYYYLLTILNGVQKQIALVYGSWVVIDLLRKGADTMALLFIASSFVCIFFMHLIGRMIDRFGIKKMMFLDAATFIGVYVLYGFLVWGITSSVLPGTGWPVFAVYLLFVLDRMSMQIGVVKSVYLRSISLSDEDVTATLSTGVSLDHLVSIIAAMAGGFIWAQWGSQWVFFMAAAFSLGNVYIAWRVQPERERETALAYRAAQEKM
ncbi:MAG: hypothetical protein ABT01_02520 [Clostridium sp. SCN 57-10]|nr:MAG: hypothetical protein ABT01_02520 [Clostridium sp. SCN 57-10]